MVLWWYVKCKIVGVMMTCNVVGVMIAMYKKIIASKTCVLRTCASNEKSRASGTMAVYLL